MTLKEIANEAGVSISTVSRVVNMKGKKAASKDVQDRIWDIVRKVGYVPNSSAQNLKKHAVGGSLSDPNIIACLFARAKDSIRDPFFSQLSRSIEETSFQQNYIVKYMFTSLDLSNPATINSIIDEKVKGVFILGRCDQPLLHTLKKCFNHVVYSGLNILDAKYDQIICDGLAAAQTAVQYLIGLGHEQIGYIGETENEIRFTGYRETLLSHKLTVNPKNIANVILSSEGGYRGAKTLLEKAPDLTAIFCANDTTAIGAHRAIQEAGLKIPAEISIISIDDIEISQYLSPMLTTVHIPIEEMGRMAAKTLIDRIDNGHRLPMQIKLPFYIAERESCAKPRRQSKVKLENKE